MSRMDVSAQDLFLRLGKTPRTRSVRADKLFRRLRNEEEQAVTQSIFKAPARVRAKPDKSDAPDASTVKKKSPRQP